MGGELLVDAAGGSEPAGRSDAAGLVAFLAGGLGTDLVIGLPMPARAANAFLASGRLGLAGTTRRGEAARDPA
ncbi:MAG TPA: hypothetical protein VL359_13845, partial [bacterium]|nr:hypothetical protein [bacterium]